MIKKFSLLLQFIFILGITVCTVIPSISSESFIPFALKSESAISPNKCVQTFKATQVKSESVLSEFALRDQVRPKFLKLIYLTLGFVCFSTILESKLFSKQLSYGLLFSESFLKLFNDPSSHPIRPQGPPTI